MRPADETTVPTFAEVINAAVHACDPEGTDELLDELLVRFEDRDEPVTAVADVEGQVSEAAGRLAPEGEDPALTMAVAVATYLAHRRDELDSDRDDLLRLAARAEFDGSPPATVADWLLSEGVAL